MLFSTLPHKNLRFFPLAIAVSAIIVFSGKIDLKGSAGEKYENRIAVCG